VHGDATPDRLVLELGELTVRRLPLALLAAAVLIGGCGGGSSPSTGTRTTTGARSTNAGSPAKADFRATSGRQKHAVRVPFSPLHVSGNQVLNRTNQSVVIHGTDRSGTEYACAQGNGLFDGTGTNLASEEAQIAEMASWGINSELIGLNEDCWLGINGVNASYSRTAYRNAIKSLVQTDEKHHIYPVIALYWMAPGRTVPTGSPVSQDPMPDNDHAPLLWEEVADAFKNDPYVIFRLKEEAYPGGSGIQKWRCWSQGDVSYSTSSDNAPPTPPTPTGRPNKCAGLVTDPSAGSYRAVGMQSLINIIRGTGATNIIQVPGVDYANNLSCTETDSPVTCGFLDSTDGIKLSDPHSPAQLMADVDVYPDTNVCGNTSCYDDTYMPVAQVMPLVAGETGPGGAATSVTVPDTTFLHWMDQHANGYYAWAWDTWAGLISSYSSATPASPWGTAYKAWIEGTGVPVNTAPPSIQGTVRDGETLSVNGGTWSPTGAPAAYQWQRCTSSSGGCSNISGATTGTYAPTASDVGSYLKASVTYGNWNGEARATTAEAGPVAALPQPTDGITFTQFATAACNIGVPTGTLNLTSAVKAGDDLFAVFSGMGYTVTADQIDSVSDNVNGAWRRLAHTGSQANGPYELSYSVFELLNSKAAPSGLTLTTTGTAGTQDESPSGVVVAARGVASATAGSFHRTLQAGTSPFTAPALASVPADDVVMGLWGLYSGNSGESFSAPAGWNTARDYQVYGVNCPANAMDWTQPSSAGSVTPSIKALASDYMGGGIDLHP